MSASPPHSRKPSPPASPAAPAASREGIRSLLVNGEATQLPAPCCVAELLAHLELAEKRVAVAVNREVVVRSRYAEVELAEGDRIEILEAVGGG